MQQFKVGDWILLLEKQIHQIKAISKDGSKLFLDTQESPQSDNWWEISQCELWQPKVGEWCWFNNSSLGIWFISTLKDFGTYNGSTQYRCDSVYYVCEKCEPFIGELPSFLKEQT